MAKEGDAEAPSTPSDYAIGLKTIGHGQGILSVPGIAGYKWVPARIGRFYQQKILFLFYQ